MSRKIETNIKVKKLNIIIEFTEHVISRNKKQQSNSGMEIPDYAIERIARCLLPIMQEHFESEEGNGNPFQYSCLENPMDREA